MKKVIRFFKSNYIPFLFFIAAVLIELTGVMVTSGKFYVSTPWLWITLIAALTAFQFLFKSQTFRYWFSSIMLIGMCVFDLVFIVIYEMTGTIFDFSMLSLRHDAMAIVESVPINFTYFTVAAVIISLFMVFGKIPADRTDKPTVNKFTRIGICGFLVAVVAVHCVCGYLVVKPAKFNDLSQKLYQTSDSSYADRSIIGNFLGEMYQKMYFKVDVGDVDELKHFVYDDIYDSNGNGITSAYDPDGNALSGEESISLPTEYFGVARDENGKPYNVITILCESLEWFAFMMDRENFPYGHYAGEEFESISDEAAYEELKQLYPNLYAYYENDIIMTNFHSREKTDISENFSIIGNYPTDYYINYDYPKNTLPYSMPNMMRELFGSPCTSYHDGQTDYYNRNQHHTNALGFDSFTASEKMEKMDGDFKNYMDDNGERNLDSEMIRTCADMMFPTKTDENGAPIIDKNGNYEPLDVPFYTYITTITMHGQYSERDNLSKYYQKFDEYGILPVRQKGYDNYQSANIFRNYAAACMELDAALGEIDKELEKRGLKDNTIIALFGDHNAYYSSLSNYVKNIYKSEPDDRNFTDLYKVPFIIRVGDSQIKARVDKFTCTADIMPTILDLIGVRYYDNMLYGHSAFSATESVLYSRAYDIFMTDKILFSTLNNISYRSPDVDEAYLDDLEKRSLVLLDKISHVNRLFVADFFKGDNGAEFSAKTKQINGISV